jgi:hypothetical protein
MVKLLNGKMVKLLNGKMPNIYLSFWVCRTQVIFIEHCIIQSFLFI